MSRALGWRTAVRGPCRRRAAVDRASTVLAEAMGSGTRSDLRRQAMAERTRPPARLLAPWHWPAWLGLGVLWLVARMPWPMAMRAGARLGPLLHLALVRRRRIAQRNLELCFPELAAAERDALLRDHFRDLGRMFVEFSLSWMASNRRFDAIPFRIEGLEHLKGALANGNGVLMVGAHFTHLELCARLIGQALPLAGMYREHGSPVFEWAIRQRRLAYAKTMFGRRELRATVRFLKRGGGLWYAPDQDMRGKDSVFAPFFGIPASTITATHHLARMSGAAVVMFAHRRLPGEQGYVLELSPALTGFPSDDAVADTTRINAQIEAMVRAAPSQYLWIHRRFKTRPPGDPPIYP
jgi:KDO2-lipid IV(A) lauroyltransferase